MAVGKSLNAVKNSARRCKACPLWANATQTVFGEGPPRAAVMLVGEQPGDREDLAGKPFVGPAGRMLDRALAQAGLDRAELYVTNAVKHFKNEPRGKRRIHKKPSDAEIEACNQWLERELALVEPRLIVALTAVSWMTCGRRRTEALAPDHQDDQHDGD
jgi:uracil-DNA glycosylase family protein